MLRLGWLDEKEDAVHGYAEPPVPAEEVGAETTGMRPYSITNEQFVVLEGRPSGSGQGGATWRVHGQGGRRELFDLRRAAG
ncbi:hypothetical protein [Streptosporangium sp. NPDC049644]|uniref:hypothetical protein n=1 Tax=Streptosporangium sp. NPDC049644 TaxID=3155507 RepID=UPI00343B0587